MDLPQDLWDFYARTNGLDSGWLKVLPLADATTIKRTWDSLQRANDPSKTAYFGGDEELLHRFLIFAALDAVRCAAFDRSDGTIWYEEDGELQQTDLNLSDFIELCLREVREL